MEKWEYRVIIIKAGISAPGVKDFLKKLWPKWKPPRFAPESIIPDLNQWGANGWELVSIEPVFLDKDHAIKSQKETEDSFFTTSYLCAFKRKHVAPI